MIEIARKTKRFSLSERCFLGIFLRTVSGCFRGPFCSAEGLVKHRFVLAAGIPTLLLTSVAGAALVTETFDSAASASANGWTATGDGVNGQVVGWSNTSDAGGTAGEGRAQLTKGWPSRDGYRDVTLGGAFTVNNAMEFTGKFDLAANSGDAEQIVFGYSSTTRDSAAGILFVRNSTTGAYQWGLLISSPDGSVRTTLDVFGGFDASRAVTPGVDRTISFAYDPSANGGNGSVTGSVSGAGDPLTINLTANQRAELGDATYDAFGLNRVPLGLFSSTSNQADFRFDNLTYTVVPEPTATAMLLLGTSLLARRRRR
jgi:hypothetical protein